MLKKIVAFAMLTTLLAVALTVGAKNREDTYGKLETVVIQKGKVAEKDGHVIRLARAPFSVQFSFQDYLLEQAAVRVNFSLNSENYELALRKEIPAAFEDCNVQWNTPADNQNIDPDNQHSAYYYFDSPSATNFEVTAITDKIIFGLKNYRTISWIDKNFVFRNKTPLQSFDRSSLYMVVCCYGQESRVCDYYQLVFEGAR